jgi:hypothetical protein
LKDLTLTQKQKLQFAAMLIHYKPQDQLEAAIMWITENLDYERIEYDDHR